VTCIATLKKDLEEHDACSMLVLGTEAGQVKHPDGSTLT